MLKKIQQGRNEMSQLIQSGMTQNTCCHQCHGLMLAADSAVHGALIASLPPAGPALLARVQGSPGSDGSAGFLGSA